MREILFRGKRRDNGKWVKGYYVEEWNSTYIHSRVDRFTFPVEIDPETLSQYIELKDDNGEKIFEGDILRLRDKINNLEWTAVVEFGNPNGNCTWGFDLKRISGEEPNTDILLWVDTEMSEQTSCEIIGNIFDKPNRSR